MVCGFMYQNCGILVLNDHFQLPSSLVIIVPSSIKMKVNGITCIGVNNDLEVTSLCVEALME